MATLEDLIRLGSTGALSFEAFQSTAGELKLSPAALCDAYARAVAQGYVGGRMAWRDGDAAMNNLYALAYVGADIGLPAFAREVFSAFDAGEFDHADPEPNGEPRTRRILATLLRKSAG